MWPFLNLYAFVYYALEEYILKIINIITNLPKISNVKRFSHFTVFLHIILSVVLGSDGLMLPYIKKMRSPIQNVSFVNQSNE